MSTVKLFADETSLFSVVRDSNISVYELNNDMQKYLNGFETNWIRKWYSPGN